MDLGLMLVLSDWFRIFSPPRTLSIIFIFFEEEYMNSIMYTDKNDNIISYYYLLKV